MFQARLRAQACRMVAMAWTLCFVGHVKSSVVTVVLLFEAEMLAQTVL